MSLTREYQARGGGGQRQTSALSSTLDEPSDVDDLEPGTHNALRLVLVNQPIEALVGDVDSSLEFVPDEGVSVLCGFCSYFWCETLGESAAYAECEWSRNGPR